MKRFKVKIIRFSRNKYQVKFAYYWLVPKFKSLNFWFEQTLTDDTECWSTKLFNLEDAEQLVENLKSISDVKEWYKPYEKKRDVFYERQAEYYKKNGDYDGFTTSKLHSKIM